MPRAKKNQELASEKEVIKTVKPKPKVKTKTVSIEKKVVPKKKARPVVIDVIEDDEPANFFPELPAIKPESLATPSMPISENFGEKENSEPEIDQQKKFFSDLVTEIKEKGQKTAPGHNQDQEIFSKEQKIHKSVGLYRRLVWRFIAFTVFLTLVVFYFSFSKLTISISPKGETINDSLLLKIQPTSTSTEKLATDFREEVPGTIKEITINEEKTFPSTGEEFTGEEISGQVKIINNSTKAQALVATTRILSPDNKLFRIKDAVNVPSGGEVSVDIYAEKPSVDLAITATTFTIPGLWLGLQDKIYAKSNTDFVFRQKVKKYIKASDIEAAMKEMSGVIIAKAKINEKSVGANDETMYENLDSTSFETSAHAGDVQDYFTVQAKANLAIITFSRTDAAKLTAAKLSLLVPDDKELVDYDPKNINYNFDSYDAKTGVATVKANFTGTMVLKNNAEIIDKKQLVNLNRQQLENYLKAFPEIKNYEFKFFPSFINRSPRLPERIDIKIKGLEK